MACAASRRVVVVSFFFLLANRIVHAKTFSALCYVGEVSRHYFAALTTKKCSKSNILFKTDAARRPHFAYFLYLRCIV